MAPISTRGAITWASMATAAALSPTARRRLRAFSSGRTRRIHPRLRSGEIAAAGAGATRPGGTGGS